MRNKLYIVAQEYEGGRGFDWYTKKTIAIKEFKKKN